MGKYAWIFIADRDSWLDCAQSGSFGLKRAPGRVSDAQSGDPIIAYIKGEMTFAGIGILTSSYYYATQEELQAGLYPHRVKLEIKLDFDNSVDVRSLIEQLDFITDKPYWPVFFKGGVAKIPHSDFEIIKASIEKQKTRIQATSGAAQAVGREDINQLILSLPDLASSSLHDRIAEMIHVVGLRMGYDSIQRYKTRVDSPYQIDVAWLQKKSVMNG
jgi:hypothetical protein